MIRLLLIGILLIAGEIHGNGQTDAAGRLLMKARYQVSGKMYGEALRTIDNSQSVGPEASRAALTMGQALSGLKRYDESNRWLMQVTGDGLADAAYAMAKNYIALNDNHSAIESLRKHLAEKNHYPEKTIRLDPDFAKLENERNWVHLWQTDWYSESEQQAAEFDYLLANNQVVEAMALANRFRTAYPDDPRGWFLLAKAHHAMKDDWQFRLSMDHGTPLAAQNNPLMEEMLRLCMEAEYFNKANVLASQLIRNDPTNPDYQISRALIRIMEGKESLAIKEIAATEEAGIAPAELYYQAGQRVAKSIPFQAESWFTKAIDGGRLDARYYFARGLARISLEKTDEALSDFAMSLDINPNQPDLYATRAQIRLDIGDNDGACHDWKKAMEMGNTKAADLLYKYCRLP
ncbi:MAG: hypothetical protein WC699_06465 [Bacteroidales bacterium]|jgi:tetratricopeptide (TPR) repeat protein